jgi:hypothetical protein
MSETGFVYYYSTKELKRLKSAVGKGVTKEQEEEGEEFGDRSLGGKLAGGGRYIRDILTYGSLPLRFFGFDHKPERGIAMSLDPIPLDIAKLYGGKHKFWKSGITLYQYKVIIGSSSLEGIKGNIQLHKDNGMPYRIVGSKPVRDLIYEKQEWNLDEIDEKQIKKNEKEIVALEKSLGFYGFWGLDLIHTVAKARRDIKKTIEENVSLLTKRKQESVLYGELYPWVPHLVLYTGFVGIGFDSVEVIKLK